MFTATADLVLPTTVTGSWPRPRWYDARLDGRPLSTRMKDVVYREQLGDALAVLLDEQERAGLDILTHGDYFHDEEIGGHQWHRYVLERWRGLKGDYARISPELPSFAPGTILNEIFGGWRWPRVVGKIEPNEDAPLEYAKLWRLAKARTSRPVKFGTVCAQGLNPLLDVEDGYDPDDRRQLIWDLATTMNEELRALAAGGCRVIQVEEPLLHYLAMYHPEKTDQIDFLVDAFNQEVAGLEDVEVWVHTCWGNPNMQRAMDEVSYANSLEIYLDRLNADVWTVEMKDAEGVELKLFGPYKETMRKKIAVGVVSHRDLQVETPAEVAAMTREALRYINPENLILSTDCGFGRQGANRLIAFYKAASIAMGANIVRRELGLEERPVPAADPALQVDAGPRPEESRLFAGFSGQ
jgi:5-methyltetrahydropteroyltriglutamate--homocysteine methyltransferase